MLKSFAGSGVGSEEERLSPSVKLNVKNGPPLRLYFGFQAFFVFSGVFYSDLGFYYSHPHAD